MSTITDTKNLSLKSLQSFFVLIRTTSHPHQIVIDLGDVQTVSALCYLPRNGANPGKIKEYPIYADDNLFHR